MANVCAPRQVASSHSFSDLQVVEVNSLSYSQSPADALFSLLIRQAILCTGALDDSRKQASSESSYSTSTVRPVPICQKLVVHSVAFKAVIYWGQGRQRERVALPCNQALTMTTARLLNIDKSLWILIIRTWASEHLRCSKILAVCSKGKTMPPQHISNSLARITSCMV
jgi:hypothetical protein